MPFVLFSPKKKDAKSVVIFLKCDQFLACHMAVMALKELKIYVCSGYYISKMVDI